MLWLGIITLLIAAGNALSQNLWKRDVVPNCQTDLSGPFEFPHLIVPIDRSNPDDAAGTSFHGQISENVSTIFNFDIPIRGNLTECTLIFIYPETDRLDASAPTFDRDGKPGYSFEGDGKVRFSHLDGPADSASTANYRPIPVEGHSVDITLQPGTTHVIRNFPCPGGQAIGVEMANAGTTELRYFQDSGAIPYVIPRCSLQAL